MIEAKDNEAVARFSLEFGVRAGAHITSLPAIPIARFERRDRGNLDAGETDVSLAFSEGASGSAEQGELPPGPALA